MENPAYLYKCPICGVKAGQWCVEKGSFTTPHSERKTPTWLREEARNG